MEVDDKLEESPMMTPTDDVSTVVNDSLEESPDILVMPPTDDVSLEQPNQCIEAYQELITTYNTSLLKKLPHDVVDACTEYANESAILPVNGKTRRVLAKLIENHQDDKRPIASYIGGPMNISCHWSEKYKKMIYIFGEFHFNGDDCHKLTKGRFDNPEIINIVDYLKQYFSFPTAFTDFYLEMPAFIMPEGYYYRLGGNIFNLWKLRDTFHKCVDATLRNEQKDCNLSRMHYFDIRQGDVKDSLQNPISIFLRDGYQMINILSNKPYNMFIILKNLKAFHATYYNLITLFSSEDNQEYYNMWYNQINEFGLLQKELSRVIDGYEDEKMKDIIENFIKEEMTLNLRSTIMSQGETVSRELLRKASIYFNKLCASFFKECKDTQGDIEIKRKEKYFTNLHASLIKIHKICLIYNCIVIDGYLLARVFKKFDIDTQDLNKKRQTDEPKEPHNIIIYAGNAHSKVYRKFLTQLGFEDKGNSGQMDHEKIVFDTDDSVHKCVDMSKIKQPFFYDWPPIKLKTRQLLIPKNPSVPNKHELFKIPKSVTNISGHLRYNKLSYKHQIPTILPEVADMLLYRHRAGQKK